MHKAQHIDRVWTVLDLIKWGSDYFRQRSVDSPRLTIELLLCHILDVTRVELYSTYERPCTTKELATLKSYIQRRIHGEPLQYIIGEAPFFGRMFTVTPSVLIPRPETEHLADHALRYCRGHRPTHALDIGTGSGCIPIAVAAHDDACTWNAIDVDPDAVNIARANAEQHGVSDRVSIQLLDLFTAIPGGTYQLITMNPPYIPADEVSELQTEVRDYEPHRALTDDADGLRFYERLTALLTNAPFLSNDGTVLVEVMAGQADIVERIFMRNGGRTQIIADVSGIPRIVQWWPS